MSDDDVATGELMPVALGIGEVERMLLDPTIRVEDDPEASARAIVERILSASTEADVFGSDEVTHAADMIDVPFVIISARFMPSTKEGEGPGIYAVMDGATDDGEKLIVTCGARTVMAQLVWAATHNGFPDRYVIRQKENPTRRGYRPMKLEKAPKDKDKPDSF